MTKADTKYDYDLLVIGGGPAGQRAAVQAAKIRKRVCIVDKLIVVGGNCVNTGTIPSKSFKEAVVFLSGYRQRNIYGAGYRVKSEIEMKDLTFRCNRILQIERDVIRHQLSRNHIDMVEGHARFVDKHCVEITTGDGNTVKKTANIILIAVGAKPHRPENIEFDG
ncbi:MAG: FAD-dependent oxidoreductase, partial [Bdellovibrionales bacterium]|nr:FAD-dependent oxidoreductase [Bdellovibrionales bacterium]